MAERRISSLVAVETPDVLDVLPIVNANITKKVSLNNLVKTSDFSTWNIDNLPDPVPAEESSMAPTDVLVVHDNIEPKKVRLQNIYPRPVDSSTIDLTFSTTSRVLSADVITGSIDTIHIADSAITEEKIDPSAKIGGATGAGTDRSFYLNDQTINFSYNIPSGKNAMSAGTMTVQGTAVVTVPDGSTWTVV